MPAGDPGRGIEHPGGPPARRRARRRRSPTSAEAALREAQRALVPFPALAHAGFLHDAEKEYVEARAVAALVAGAPVPGPGPAPGGLTCRRRRGCGGWPRRPASCAATCSTGCARATSSAARRCWRRWTTSTTPWSSVDYPDALTNGLRRTLDALRAVLERSRGDVTTTVLQTRLQRAIEGGPDLS